MRNSVQLITYVDRLAETLSGLADVLAGPLDGLFEGVHLLPFFTPYDGADAGFDPTDHTAVDPRLGTWEDVGTLGERYEVMADLIVNHMSVQSDRFKDAMNNPDSEYAGMFLTYGSVFGDGAAEDDLLRIYRPRPGLPFKPLTRSNGERLLAWMTFTSEQIDLDVKDPHTVAYLQNILDRFADAGVDVVRLDAIGYAVKTPGTSCFMTPETLSFTAELTKWARERGMEVLVEIHSHYQTQLEIAENVDWVYDFALPPLLLHTIYTGDAAALKRWCAMRPHRAVNVLDTHDGIGVLDVAADSINKDRPGLLTSDELHALVEGIHERSGGQSREATGSAASNVDLYQVNCTYYDALGRDDATYLLARLVQMFLPGVPQIYYVGLLGGTNDMELLAKTNVGRDINRHYYTGSEIEEAARTPMVRALSTLIRWRNDQAAFDGEWAMAESDDHQLQMSWRHDSDELDLMVDFQGRTFALTVTDGDGQRQYDDFNQLGGLVQPTAP